MTRNYQIQNLIGEGGMGVVYKATDTTLERTVAIKILHNHLIKDPVFYERFRNEAVLLARLNHPNVTTLYNFSSEEDQRFMVMEYVEGITLEQLLKQEKVLPSETVVRIISSAANGLQHAHEKGILHRDIKSSNIMISEKGEIKLMDFGIAKMKGSASLTRVGSIIGTLEYMAPELLSGSAPSVASDLYAMGVVMYELLTGKLPFEGNTEASLINSIVHQKPLPLRTYTTGIPKELEDILENLLKKKPEKRVAGAEELKTLLQKVPVTRTDDFEERIRRKVAHSTRGISRTFLHAARTLPRWLNSREGYIIAGGFVIASLILILRPRPSPFPEAEKLPSEADSALVEPVVTPSLSQQQTPHSPINSSPFTVDLPVDKTPEKVLPEEPVKKRPVTSRPSEEKAAEPVISLREAEEKTKTGEKKEELMYKPPPEEARESVSEQKISLEDLTVSLALDETVSSDDPAAKGKVISFKVTQDIFSQGIRVVAEGAVATGRILKIRSSESGKPFLEIRPESVRAVNGEVLKLKSPPLGRSGSTTGPVIFSKGIRISPDPRIINKSIKL